MSWIDLKTQLPPEGVEVLGYSPDWIHPDFNLKGVRVCFLSNDEWHSSKWDNDQDCWHTHAKWCCEENGGRHFDPTHWMHLPEAPTETTK